MIVFRRLLLCVSGLARRLALGLVNADAALTRTEELGLLD